MTKQHKILQGMEEAVAYAKGQPVEGTRESWYDPAQSRWRSRTFKDGKWVENDAPASRNKSDD